MFGNWRFPDFHLNNLSYSNACTLLKNFAYWMKIETLVARVITISKGYFISFLKIGKVTAKKLTTDFPGIYFFTETSKDDEGMGIIFFLAPSFSMYNKGNIKQYWITYSKLY